MPLRRRLTLVFLTSYSGFFTSIKARPKSWTKHDLGLHTDGKRGYLILQTLMNHYVDVATTRDKHFMGFSDTVAKTHSAIGLQVRRSYWVAHGQIEGHKHIYRRLLLIMFAQKKPVSASFRKALHAMRVLPSKRR
ncbi:MAG: hypothetical protein P8M25_09280 [Paracoccaceae bacterium]|nr:hypothetical protein [Paracoccaceae bacterium]